MSHRQGPNFEVLGCPGAILTGCAGQEPSTLPSHATPGLEMSCWSLSPKECVLLERQKSAAFYFGAGHGAVAGWHARIGAAIQREPAVAAACAAAHLIACHPGSRTEAAAGAPMYLLVTLASQRLPRLCEITCFSGRVRLHVYA